MSVSAISSVAASTPSFLPSAGASAADFAGLMLSSSAGPANANALYKSGQLGLQMNDQGKPATIIYYDAQGGELTRGSFTPEQILANVTRFSIPKSNLADLGSTLDAHGVGYKPGEMFAGQYGAGIDLKNLSEGGMGTSYDWTQDSNVALKGPSAAAQLAASQALAASLGVTRTFPTTAATPALPTASAAPAPVAASSAAATVTMPTMSAAPTAPPVATASTAATPTAAASKASSHKLDLLLASQSHTVQAGASDVSRAYARRLRAHHG